MKVEPEKPPPPAPKEEPKPAPAPPPPKVVEVPYLWSYSCPYTYPVWPSDCCCHHDHGDCHCCSCGKAPEASVPPPMLQYVPQPYPCNPCGGGYRIVCEEDPSYACAIM